jgi:hypothetical protein
MYVGLVEWCRASMLRPDSPLASPGDIDIPICVDDGAGILKIIRRHHAAWRKRQVKQQTV